MEYFEEGCESRLHEVFPVSRIRYYILYTSCHLQSIRMPFEVSNGNGMSQYLLVELSFHDLDDIVIRPESLFEDCIVKVTNITQVRSGISLQCFVFCTFRI